MFQHEGEAGLQDRSCRPQRLPRARPGELLHVDIKKFVRITGLGYRITGDRRYRARATPEGVVA
jgi:hypothetical protein